MLIGLKTDHPIVFVRNVRLTDHMSQIFDSDQDGRGAARRDCIQPEVCYLLQNIRFHWSLTMGIMVNNL
jgi:hypothetical protein